MKARVFIKYAANSPLTDTGAYDEAHTAAPEPGFPAYIHVTNLKAGTYFLRAMYGNAIADTAIGIGALRRKKQS